MAMQGVWGAAGGAGIIIGSYFAFYSNTKKILREHTDLSEGTHNGQIACSVFISQATAFLSEPDF
jgi:hypothetical protein